MVEVGFADLTIAGGKLDRGMLRGMVPMPPVRMAGRFRKSSPPGGKRLAQCNIEPELFANPRKDSANNNVKVSPAAQNLPFTARANCPRLS
jgi:hypothetical protein